jgi:hypothetical protein
VNDPRRWRDDPSELGELELRALEAGRSAAPPRALRDDVWQTLSATLAAPGAGGEGGGGSTDMGGGSGAIGSLSSTGKALGVAALVKSGAVGAVIGTAVMIGANVLAHRPAEEASRPAAAAQHAIAADGRTPSAARMPEVAERAPQERTPAPRSVEPGRLAEPPRETVVPSAGAVAAFPDTATPSRAEPHAAAPSNSTPAAVSARQESRLIASARQALRAGNPALALSLLEQARARFAHGILAQERDALSIEALAASGQRAQAQARARDFMVAYPSSPHIARIQAVVSGASHH